MLQTAKIARIGDNMREVAVTEGDKVAAQIQFGYAVNGYGLGDVVKLIKTCDRRRRSTSFAASTMNTMPWPTRCATVRAPAKRSATPPASNSPCGHSSTSGGFVGYTDTFENLHGLKQLPGIASQRLMADGYGFGAEGDWKAAAMLRAAKVMAAGLPGGTSFMEDYTYHLPANGDALVLGSHMLEICPSIAAGQPSCEIHPLGIGGKEDPVRLVFDAPAGPAVNATLVDLGDRFRMVLNEVEVVNPTPRCRNCPWPAPCGSPPPT